MRLKRIVLQILVFVFSIASAVANPNSALSSSEERAIESESIERQRDFQKILEARERELRLHTGDLADGVEQLRTVQKERAEKAERARSEHVRTRTVYRSEVAEALEAKDEEARAKEELKRDELRHQFVARRMRIEELKKRLPSIDPNLELRIPPWTETDFKSSYASPNGFKPSSDGTQ